jgi:hypothetical protein
LHWLVKAVIIRAVRVEPCVYIPQTDIGSYMRAIIRTRNAHNCYFEIDKYIKPMGLYSFKVHDGYLVLITDDDPLYITLFTVSPIEQVKLMS